MAHPLSDLGSERDLTTLLKAFDERFERDRICMEVLSRIRMIVLDIIPREGDETINGLRLLASLKNVLELVDSVK